jgi:hypothetical protein
MPLPQLPLPVLKEALKKVPSLKYAIGTAVILWILALAVFWKLPLPVAIFGSIGIFVLMVLLVLFAKVAALPARKFSIPAVAIVWSFVPVPPLVVMTLYSCVFFGWPRDLGHWLGDKAPVAQEAPEPTITLRGTPLNLKQKSSLGSLGIALKGPDDVFNSKEREWEDQLIENWVCKFEWVDKRPKSPEETRQFRVNFDDNFKAICFLKPGVVGEELDHLNPGDEFTLAKAWSRKVAKSLFPDEKRGLALTIGVFHLTNCELKTPL